MRRNAALAFGTAVALMIGVLATMPIPARASGWVTIHLEDFDGDWTSDWHTTDYNTDSSLDYWGPSDVRGVGGSHSAWCAQVGSNSINYEQNSDNGYYDQDMQAALQIDLPDMSGYTEVKLGFTYWALTGTTILNDYLEVRAWMGTFWDHLWKQPDVDSDGWDFVYPVEVPINAVWLCFTFISDDDIGAGPYEGVYVDDVIVEGLDEESPTSTVSDLHDYYTNHTLYVPYVAMDQGGSGVDYVELYYRLEGVAGYTKYTTAGNPEGQWTGGFIPFDCEPSGGDGTYEFYTIAVDIAENTEALTEVPQASCTVDTVTPETSMTVLDGEATDNWQNSSVSVELVAFDSGSGVDATRYRIGDGSWLDCDGPVTISEQGEYNFSYYSVDLAGNVEGIRTIPLRLDLTGPTGELVGGDTTYTNSTVVLSWSSEDLLSGVDYCLLKVDDRAFEYFGDPSGEVTVSQLTQGDHTATLKVRDCAGNWFETTANFTVDLGVPGPVSTPEDYTMIIVAGLILLVIVIAGITMVLRRKKAGP